jgi:hypothetical protein
MVALQHAVALDEPSDVVAAARVEVERLSHGLPAVAMAAHADEVRRAARACVHAAAAAERRRAFVGERPSLDEASASGVLDAHRAVGEARAGLREVVADGHRLIAIGNAWGVLALGGAAFLSRHGVEMMATPVFAAVAGAAAGPVTMSVISVSRRSFAAMRVDAARAAWAAALEASGFATMGDLHARRIAVDAWRRRSSEADAADAAASEARAAWHRLVGDSFSPIEGPLLAFRLASLRAAQLRLLRALLDERARGVGVGVGVGGAVHEATGEPALPALSPSSRWSGGALARLRGRTLRLWAR